MTSRRPTISVRLATLERLARANEDAPESQDFAPISWSELDRTSLAEGIEDLLAYRREREAVEEETRLEEVRKKALRRAIKREQARKWEQELIEKERESRLERRIEEERTKAVAEANEILAARQNELEAVLRTRADEQECEREIAHARVAHEKRGLKRGAQFFAIAAALGCAVWASALGQAKSSTMAEYDRIWEEAKAEEFAAHARVAELEAEVDRHVHLGENEIGLLEEELSRAKSELAEAEDEREAIDRRRPTTEQPGRLAQVIETTTKPPVVEKAPAPHVPTGAVRVATDEIVQSACSPYDPLCFEL